MPWWKSRSTNHLLSSSSASPSSGIRFFPWSRREPQPRLTRQRKLRHLTDLQIEALSLEDPVATSSSSTPVSRSHSNLDATPSRSASSPMLLPRPLPLPEAAAASPHRESVSGRGLGFSPPNSVGFPLPSPSGASNKVEDDQGNGVAAEPTSPVSALGRLAYQTNCRSPEQVNISLDKSTISHRRKVLQDSNSSETMNFRLKIPARSIPISKLSSPVLSPGKLSNVDFSSSAICASELQLWPAPKTPSPSMMTLFSSQTLPGKMIPSPDHSPLCSPTTRSPILRSRNPSAPSSPLHAKMFPENSAAWHGNGGNINVHPLPLPPGATPCSQSAFAPQSAARAEASLKANQWKKGKLIGSGTFGNVYEATNRHNGALCAMKEVNIIPDDAKSAECLKQLEQEIRFLSQFKHPNIVQYYGSETIANRLYIYLEYVHPGSINKYVRQYCGAISESVVRNFTRHILNGLIYLHSKQIMHRDIKGANLLVDVNGVVKLADFGMAKHLSGAAPANSLKGSPFWMAPEMLHATMNKETGYDLSVDIWSLGCTIIEMFTGKHPWSGLEGPQAMFKVLNKDPPIPETLSIEGKDFLQRCFCRNPAERPTAGMLLEHPFVRNCHYHNFHGSLQTFAGIKFDSAFSPRDKGKFESEPSVKRKYTSDHGNKQSHPEVSESAASSHYSSRFTVEVSPSLSPRSSQLCSSVNTEDVVQFGGGDYFSLNAFPRPYDKKEVNFF
nr:PREDICTED: mitogen-activated protein kinase kinase kinase YODA-like isoform X2 [Musa acuminata subsp. malaccensis]